MSSSSKSKKERTKERRRKVVKDALRARNYPNIEFAQEASNFMQFSSKIEKSTNKKKKKE